MSNIGIIGYGFVGKAVEHGFKEKHKTLYYDKFKESTPLNEVIENSEFIFICLPTPFHEGTKKIDLSIMDESIKNIAPLAQNTSKILIIKSTVTPGTTEKYSKKYPSCSFCFNPEFLTEKNYLQDFMNTDRIVIGSESGEISKRVQELYKTIFPDTKIFLTSTKAAEMCKYMANCFLITKVLFANEIYSLCEHLKINYDEVKEMVLADSRIGNSHLTVPGPDGDFGFGGKCFPKDLIALLGLYKELGLDSSLLNTVWEKNLRIRKHKDWEHIPGAVSNNNNFHKNP